jgi:hypothetical protein
MILLMATCPALLPASLFPFFAGAFEVMVGHKPKAITLVGRVDGTSWDNDRPAGVVLCFQVSRHSVEPVLANRRRNLFSHDDSGPSGTDEAKEVGPQVPIVILGFSFARDGERLARGAASPELAVVGPPSKSSCKGPTGDAGEEVALPVSGEV